MRRGPLWVLLAALVAAVVIVRFVRLDPDVAALLPAGGEAGALSTYAKHFGAGEAGLFLVTGADEDAVRDAAKELSQRTRRDDGVRPRGAEALLVADKRGRDVLAKLFERDAAVARLRGTRALLLAPGGGALAKDLADDPLRLAEALGEDALARLASRDGRARVVVVEGEGSPLEDAVARQGEARLRAARDGVAAKHPGVDVALTGALPIATYTADLIRRDLLRSGVLSLVASIAVLALVSRRLRGAAAIVPPLLLGTVITGAVAALFGRTSAIASAFVSVVVGVGMDTGVHVVAAVRRALGRGEPDAAAVAVREVARPALGAAVTAGAAFALLGLSRVPSLRQLGLLAAAGEILTAIVILVATPALAERFERPSQDEKTEPPRLLVSPALRWLVAALALASIGLVAAGPLRPDTSRLVRVTPRESPHEAVYRRAGEALGRRFEPPQIVLVGDADGASARLRAERIHRALLDDHEVAEVQGPPRRQADAPSLDLDAALREVGFAPDAFAKARDALRAPTLRDEVRARFEAPFVRVVDGYTWVTLIVEGAEPAWLDRRVRALDPEARVTGYGRLDDALRTTMETELPRIGLGAAVVAAVSLFWALRRVRTTLVALFVLAAELAVVLAAMRLFGVPLHVYDALVLPVLLGITADEILFVSIEVERGGSVARALAKEAPLVATTALTTAAGFAALLPSGFDPLRHMGFVGAVGSVAGLCLALFLVPLLVRSRE